MKGICRTLPRPYSGLRRPPAGRLRFIETHARPDRNPLFQLLDRIVVVRDQAPVAVPEHLGRCGQREETGRVLSRAAQLPTAPLSLQRADAGRDVLWHG